jgi:hypothetical protein
MTGPTPHWQGRGQTPADALTPSQALDKINYEAERSANERKDKFIPQGTVTMTFKAQVLLTLQDHTRVLFNPGVHEVPESLAGHWYLLASGAEVYAKPAKPVEADPNKLDDNGGASGVDEGAGKTKPVKTAKPVEADPNKLDDNGGASGVDEGAGKTKPVKTAK